MYAEEDRKMSLKIVFQAESVKDQKRSVLWISRKYATACEVAGFFTEISCDVDKEVEGL